MHGRNVLKMMSTTQATLSLSSGESQYSGVVKGASSRLGMIQMAADLNHEYTLNLESDS